MSHSPLRDHNNEAVETSLAEADVQQASASEAATTIATTTSSDPAIDDLLTRPGPVPLVPFHGNAVGDLVAQDSTANYFGNRFSDYDI